MLRECEVCGVSDELPRDTLVLTATTEEIAAAVAKATAEKEDDEPISVLVIGGRHVMRHIPGSLTTCPPGGN